MLNNINKKMMIKLMVLTLGTIGNQFSMESKPQGIVMESDSNQMNKFFKNVSDIFENENNNSIQKILTIDKKLKRMNDFFNKISTMTTDFQISDSQISDSQISDPKNLEILKNKIQFNYKAIQIRNNLRKEEDTFAQKYMDYLLMFYQLKNLNENCVNFSMELKETLKVILRNFNDSFLRIGMDIQRNYKDGRSKEELEIREQQLFIDVCNFFKEIYNLGLINNSIKIFDDFTIDQNTYQKISNDYNLIELLTNSMAKNEDEYLNEVKNHDHLKIKKNLFEFFHSIYSYTQDIYLNS
jgi:hypothetical protein